LSRHDWILLAGIVFAAAIGFAFQAFFGNPSEDQMLVLHLTAPAYGSAEASAPEDAGVFRGIKVERTTAEALEGISIADLESGGEERYWQIQGANGPLTLHFAPGQGIEIIEAQCPDQICVRTGFIRKAGQSIVCVPNEVMVALQTAEPTKDKGDVDAILQ